MLHNERDLFETIVINTSDKFGIVPVIMGIVTINDSLKELFNKVKEERKSYKTCLSAQDGIDVKTCIQEIIKKDI